MKLEKVSTDKFWLWRFVSYAVLAVLVLLLIYYVQPDQPGINPPEQINLSPTIPPNLTDQPQVNPPKPTPLPAFPGAQGFGTSTPGGRFGRVLFVSNLNDTLDVNSLNYPGSLRWALEQTWAEDLTNPAGQRRMIIFKVGGIIPLVDSLILKQPFVTIAGQTAPGDGITLKGDRLIIATHDVIVRSIRVRVGDQGQPTCCRDGITISTTHADGDVYNVVIDHCSVSWAIDENLSTWVDPNKPFTVRDITIQWSIISEGLQNSIHMDEGATRTGPHSMGAILGQSGTNMTIHHNIFAHNWGRNPRISGIIHSEIINNVIYGWGDTAVEFSEDKNISHVLNNYFRANADSSHGEIRLSSQTHAESQVAIFGNLTYDPRDGEQLFESRKKTPENFRIARDYLFAPSNVTMSSAEVAYDDVLNFAGVIFPVRDAVDQRMIDDVKAGTGRIIDSQEQVGAWPNYQGGLYPQDTDNDGIPNESELAHGMNPDFAGDASSATVLSPSGFTWLEEYINSLIPQLPQR